MTQLEEKTRRYETLLVEGIDATELLCDPETPLGEAANEFITMAESYLEDGRYFMESDDYVNALAAFSYGHAWLDAGARIGLFSVPQETDLFSI
ncbi:MAG: DUF357 domain-containing protein [Halobacteriaceae archaeon]